MSALVMAAAAGMTFFKGQCHLHDIIFFFIGTNNQNNFTVNKKTELLLLLFIKIEIMILDRGFKNT